MCKILPAVKSLKSFLVSDRIFEKYPTFEWVFCMQWYSWLWVQQNCPNKDVDTCFDVCMFAARWNIC